MVEPTIIIDAAEPSRWAHEKGPRAMQSYAEGTHLGLWRGAWRACSSPLLWAMKDDPDRVVSIIVDGGKVERVTQGFLVDVFEGRNATMGPDHRLCRWATPSPLRAYPGTSRRLAPVSHFSVT
jgi:hypothetical protein